MIAFRKKMITNPPLPCQEMEQVKLEKEEKKAAKLARKENAHAQTPPAIVLPHLLPKATQFQLLEPSTESSCMHVAMAHQLGVPMGMLPPAPLQPVQSPLHVDAA